MNVAKSRFGYLVALMLSGSFGCAGKTTAGTDGTGVSSDGGGSAGASGTGGASGKGGASGTGGASAGGGASGAGGASGTGGASGSGAVDGGSTIFCGVETCGPDTKCCPSTGKCYDPSTQGCGGFGCARREVCRAQLSGRRKRTADAKWLLSEWPPLLPDQQQLLPRRVPELLRAGRHVQPAGRLPHGFLLLLQQPPLLQPGD